MDVISIELPDLPPREFSRNSRSHWSKRYRAQQEMNDLVIGLVLEKAVRPSEPLQRAHLKITFFLPDRRHYDADNLITRSKPIPDALVAAGVLADDSIYTIGVIDYELVYRKGKPGTLVDVRDAS